MSAAGTGKTTTVVELIAQYTRRGNKVVAAAPSNIAVDNLVERLLKANVRAVRIGHPARIMKSARHCSLDAMVSPGAALTAFRTFPKRPPPPPPASRC